MKHLTTQRLELLLLAAILLAYGVLGSAYAIRTPDWQVPDETAHYNYVRQLAETGQFPVIDDGDWNQPYQNMMANCSFHPAVVEGDPSLASINTPFLDACGYDPVIAIGVEAIEYEDHQPPLYYILQSGVYLLSDGDMTTMRLFSVLIGAGAIMFGWGVVRRVFPQQPWLALMTAGIMAFIPQRLAMMSGVNNDALAESLAGLVLLLTASYLTRETIGWRFALGMGVAAGLVLLTKTTVYYTAGIAGIAILLRWWREKWAWQIAVPQVLAYGITAVLLGSIWWIHSIDLYGGLDFLGLERHDEVVVGQLRTDDYINRDLGGSNRLYIENLTRTTFQSFWGQFGWMAYPMQPRIYTALRVLVGVLLVGTAIHAWQRRWPTQLSRSQLEVLSLLALSIFLVGLQFLIYNRTFVQFQGRYLYPALIPLALLMAMGVDGWRNLISVKQPIWQWAGLVIVVGFAAFSIYALRDVISVIPNWD